MQQTISLVRAGSTGAYPFNYSGLMMIAATDHVILFYTIFYLFIYFYLFIFFFYEKDGRNERFRRGVDLLEVGSFFEISLDGVISLVHFEEDHHAGNSFPPHRFDDLGLIR